LQAGARGARARAPTRRRRLRLQAAATETARTPKQWRESSSGISTEALQKLRLITAVKTPYLPSGKVDLYAYDHIIEQQIEAGVEGVIVGGTTGEGQLMAWDEHIMLIAHTAKNFGDRICVVGNTGSNSTKEAVHATCQGFAVGMDAALHINPYYGKTSTEGMLHHFRSVLDYGPTIVYNVPARTGQDIKPELMLKLAEHENFAGVKECEGHERIAGYTKEGVVCWSGNDDEAHDSRYEHGAVGVISVTSNVIPGLMHELMFEGANPELRDRLAPLMSWLFAQPNPIGVNTMFAMTGACQPVFRLPYCPYDREMREQGVELLRTIGVEHVLGSGEVKELDDDAFTLLSSW